jgi:tetratricopeptide (TPR) repeat protein
MLATGLIVLSLVAAVAGLIATGQLISREVSHAAAVAPTVRALGMARRPIVFGLAASSIAATMLGVVLGAIAAVAAFEQGRARLATPHFAEATRLLPAQAAAWTGLADSHVAVGDGLGALDALRKGQTALPRDAGLRLAEAHLLVALGRKTEARAAYEAALPLTPKNARARTSFGELLRDLGAAEEALRHLREAVAIDPASASGWNALGMTLGGHDRMPEAEHAFREAARLDSNNHRYAYNLGLILVRLGRAALARPFFEKALALEPAFAPAREQLAALRRREPAK